MRNMRTSNELIKIVEASNHRLNEFRLRAESVPDQFPYRFSFWFVDDRFDFELSEQEVKKLSSEKTSSDMVNRIFAHKMGLIAQKMVTAHINW